MPEVTVYACHSRSMQCNDVDAQNGRDRVFTEESGNRFQIGQWWNESSGFFSIWRGIIYFDLIGIVPEGASIISAKLYLKPYSLPPPGYIKDFYCVMQKGTVLDDDLEYRPTWPPFQSTDYWRGWYTGDYGKKHTTGMANGIYAEIIVTDLSLIIPGGITKYTVKDSWDLADVGPDLDKYEYVIFYAWNEPLQSRKPYMVIEYEEISITNVKAEVIKPFSKIRLYGNI